MSLTVVSKHMWEDLVTILLLVESAVHILSLILSTSILSLYREMVHLYFSLSLPVHLEDHKPVMRLL